MGVKPPLSETAVATECDRNGYRCDALGLAFDSLQNRWRPVDGPMGICQQADMELQAADKTW